MKKRLTYLIHSSQIIIDLIIINFFVVFFYYNQILDFFFTSYISLFWVITAYFLRFYNVYRYTRFLRILTLLLKQFSVFTLGFFAFFSFFGEELNLKDSLIILALIGVSISFMKFIWWMLLKKYRSLGNNNINVIVIGLDDSSKNIIKLFKSKSNLGYRYLGFFSNKNYKNATEKIGSENAVEDFIKNNEVDEIYCSISSVSSHQITHYKKLAAFYQLDLKLIPDTIELYSKNQNIEYYDDALMVVKVEKLPFELAENYIIKRLFDIVFSLLICILVLSWLFPILYIIIKIESKGPVIFKQQREGLNGNHFTCYKFRSMKLNALADKVHATKNDVRVTKVGSFLRRTSLDELPQFVNVLKGEMSVVGPRPHIESLSLEYQKEVIDYLKRHIMKPGITGLAQISGYRGEITKNSDIKNRVRLDIFYIENWSFFLDIKIIIKTIFKMFTKEEKAY